MAQSDVAKEKSEQLLDKNKQTEDSSWFILVEEAWKKTFHRADKR